MFGYWIKKRFLLSVIYSVLIATAYIAAFVVPYAKNVSENDLKKGVFEASSISYDIPSPTKSQLSELRSQSFVVDVFGYYITEAGLNINGNNIKAKLMISDCVDSVEMTMFNSRRAIQKGTGSYETPLYIGEDFAIDNNLKIGDEITCNGYKLTVAAIFEPDTYKGCILVPVTSGEFLNMIESSTNAYSGAYIEVNDENAAESYLRSYKPEGRLKDRDSFESDEEYQIHYDAWADASYYNEITSFSDKLNGVRLTDTNGIWIGSGVVVLIYLIVNLILFIRKTERYYFKTRKSRIGLKTYYVLTAISDLIFSGVAAITTTYICGMLNNSYVMQSSAFKAEIITSIVLVCSIVACLVVNLALLGTAVKSNKGSIG